MCHHFSRVEVYERIVDLTLNLEGLEAVNSMYTFEKRALGVNMSMSLREGGRQKGGH